MLLIKPQDDYMATHDLLKRDAIAEKLTTIISTITQPFVIAITAPFGSGKTHFIHKWRDILDRAPNKNFKTVYFNAWENDHSDFPFITFMAEIKDQLKNNTAATVKFQDAIEAAKPFLKDNILPIAARLLMSKLLGNAVTDDVKNALTELTGGIVDTTFEEYEASKKAKDAYIKRLEEAVKELNENKNDTPPKKLVIFVDELDRCRPDYAIKVLECIKHLFNVDGIIFILSIDMEQIKSSIRSIYGEHDGEGYIRKFIDWQVELQKNNNGQFIEDLYNKFDLQSVTKLSRNTGDIHSDGDAFKVYFLIFADVFNLTPRQISKAFTKINLCVRSLNDNQFAWPEILGFVAAADAAQNFPIHDYANLKDDTLGFNTIYKTLIEKYKILENPYFRKIFKSNTDVFWCKLELWCSDSNIINVKLETFNRINDNGQIDKKLEQFRFEFFKHSQRFNIENRSLLKTVSDQYSIIANLTAD